VQKTNLNGDTKVRAEAGPNPKLLGSGDVFFARYPGTVQGTVDSGAELTAYIIFRDSGVLE